MRGEESMCSEWCAVGCWIHGLGAGGEDVAVYEYVLIAGAPAFGCDYGSVVGGRDFVNDADQTFVPGVFVVFVGFGGRGAVARVGETGFDVGDSG